MAMIIVKSNFSIYLLQRGLLIIYSTPLSLGFFRMSATCDL